MTIVDETISHQLFSQLEKDFSNDDFCSEEGAETIEPIPTESEFCWVLDPVDGTNNYAVGVPECCISLGLLRHGMPVYGFIYDYGRDNLLQGGKEFGSVEGTKPVHAATNLVNEKLTFCMHFPFLPSPLTTFRVHWALGVFDAPDQPQSALPMWQLGDLMVVLNIAPNRGIVRQATQFARDRVPLFIF